MIHIARVKGSNDSTHSLDRDELRDLRKLRQQVTGLYVFETERGGPLSVDALQYIVREAGRVARLDVQVHPHMLRHAAGYTLANEGVDTRLIQDFLGHADIRHTAQHVRVHLKTCTPPASPLVYCSASTLSGPPLSVSNRYNPVTCWGNLRRSRSSSRSRLLVLWLLP